MLAALFLATTASSGPDPKLADLSWMVGKWQCEVWGGTFVESWSAPAGGSMLGSGQLIRDGRSVFEEHMAVREADGKIVMWIHAGALSDRPTASTPFTLTSLSKGVAVFRNPDHTFPDKITYTMREKQRVDCLIEGEQQGKPSQTLFEFRQAP